MLREHLLRTLQSLRLAALPMRNGIRIVQTLDPRPTESSNLDCAAIHLCPRLNYA
jgi:hypothetical protein